MFISNNGDGSRRRSSVFIGVCWMQEIVFSKRARNFHGSFTVEDVGIFLSRDHLVALPFFYGTNSSKEALTTNYRLETELSAPSGLLHTTNHELH